LNRKYGILGGADKTSMMLGTSYAGYTASNILYELARDGKKDAVSISTKLLLGLKPRWYYTGKSKKKKRVMF
jgi:hypothetical protein